MLDPQLAALLQEDARQASEAALAEQLLGGRARRRRPPQALREVLPRPPFVGVPAAPAQDAGVNAEGLPRDFDHLVRRVWSWYHAWPVAVGSAPGRPASRVSAWRSAR